MLSRFVSSVTIAAPVERVFAYHERDGALERLTPPWERLRIIARSGGIRDGGVVRARVALLGPFGPLFEAHHHGFVAGQEFRDRQARGPFSHYEHVHRFKPLADGTAQLEDEITYAVPFGALGRFIAGGALTTKLERMFKYRHVVTKADNERLTGAPMRVAITGASGLIGTALTRFLTLGGHTVLPLVRKRGVAGVYWNAESGEIDREALEGVDAVVHLAGENISEGRWTPEFRARVMDSREKGTRLIAKTIASLDKPPRVFVCASAIGFYGDTGDRAVDEGAAAGETFLAEICKRWEAAAADAGVRTVLARIGIVLSPNGGALPKLLMPARFGISSRVGAGKQWFGWVGLDDTVYALHHALTSELAGPVNVVAPNPVTQRELVETLGRVLHRPALGSVPRFVVRALLGREKADELLIQGQRVEPRVLLQDGFPFLHAHLEPMLRHVLGR